MPTCPAGNASSSMQNCWLTGELAGQHRITDAMAEAPPAKRRALAPCATAGGDDDGGGDEPNDVSVGGGHSRGSSCGDDICAVRQLCNAVGVGGEVEVCSQSFRRMGLPPWVRARVTDPGKCTVQYLETAASVTQVGAMTSMPHPTYLQHLFLRLRGTCRRRCNLNTRRRGGESRVVGAVMAV